MTRGPIGMLLGVAMASCVLAGAVGAQSSGSDPGPIPSPIGLPVRHFSILEGGWLFRPFRVVSTLINPARPPRPADAKDKNSR